MELSSISITSIATILSGPITAIFTVYLTSKVRKFSQEKEVIYSLEHELNINQSLLQSNIDKLEETGGKHLPELLFTNAFDELRAKGETRLFPYPVRHELTALYKTMNEFNATAHGQRQIENEEFVEALEKSEKSCQVLWDYLNDYRDEWSYSYPVINYFKRLKRKWIYRKNELRRLIDRKIRGRNVEDGLEIEYDPAPRTDVPVNLVFFGEPS